MEIYHFINYKKANLIEYLQKINDCNSVICLDLEDSIQDIFKPENNDGLKKCHRVFIENSLLLESNIKNIKFGIRINSASSQENEFDVKLLSKLNNRINLESVFLPKAECKTDICNLEKKLDEQKIKYKEIIAIIETKKGYSNLKEIISIPRHKLKKIAFGHCDFNFDNSVFPFHHQCSQMYWNWVSKIVSVAKSNDIGFLNSPYLQLENDNGFLDVLSKLNLLCREKFGQITLTHNQSVLCRDFNQYRKEIITGKSNGFIDLKEYAAAIVKEFEKFNTQNGFTITKRNRTLISPHEYKAALKYLRR